MCSVKKCSRGQGNDHEKDYKLTSYPSLLSVLAFIA